MSRMLYPTQLDAAMYVIRPKGWIALGTLLGFVTIAWLWAIFATVPVTVTGEGILLSPGGVREVVSQAAGRLNGYQVQVGDKVVQGQVVATIDQPDLSQKLEDAEQARGFLVAARKQTVILQERYAESQGRLMVSKRKGLEADLVRYREQLTWLQDQNKSLGELLAKQFISKQRYADNNIALSRVEQSISKATDDLKQIDLEQESAAIREKKELQTLDSQISAATTKIDALRGELERASKVLSPYDGTVVELYTAEGEVVRGGTSLFSIIAQAEDGNSSKDLMAVLYISPVDGKKVRPGMVAQVVPVVVKRTEYGGILGRVKTAADIPSSQDGMQHTLKNKNLVQSLAGGASPYEVRVSLTPDADASNATGYRWTSRAPNVSISPGTLCQVDITVNRIHPITLLIPALKPFLPDEVPQE